MRLQQGGFVLRCKVPGVFRFQRAVVQIQLESIEITDNKEQNPKILELVSYFI